MYEPAARAPSVEDPVLPWWWSLTRLTDWETETQSREISLPNVPKPALGTDHSCLPERGLGHDCPSVWPCQPGIVARGQTRARE